jgi:rod shape-determining protein MreC
MSLFFSSQGKKNILVFFLLFIVSLLMMLEGQTKLINNTKEMGDTFFYPFQVVSRVFGRLLGTSFHHDQFHNQEEEIKQLNKKIIEYQKTISILSNLKNENIELRNILSLKPQIEYESILAEVIGGDPNSYYSYLTINKGRIDGVGVNLPVITFYKDKKVVVGVVATTSIFTSRIRTIETSDLDFGVYLATSNTQGVVEGGKNLMKLLYINKEIKLNVGDEIYTSSLSEIFPPNIFVGKVETIDTTNKALMSYQAYIKPFVNLREVTKVFILKPKDLKK